MTSSKYGKYIDKTNRAVLVLARLPNRRNATLFLPRGRSFTSAAYVEVPEDGAEGWARVLPVVLSVALSLGEGTYLLRGAKNWVFSVHPPHIELRYGLEVCCALEEDLLDGRVVSILRRMEEAICGRG